jgi:hypothetical protein
MPRGYRREMTALETPRPDAAPIVTFEGWALARRWAAGSAEILGVGLMLPVALLVVGLPIAFGVRLLAALIARF